MQSWFPRFQALTPVVRKAQQVLAWFEIRDDARFAQAEEKVAAPVALVQNS